MPNIENEGQTSNEVIAVIKIGDDDFRIQRGGLLSEEDIQIIIDASHQDEEVIRFTRDAIRFENQKTFVEWLKKGRQIYILRNHRGILVGIVWVGNEIIPVKFERTDLDLRLYPATSAIRIYGSARGKGLAVRFKALSLLDYLENIDQSARGIWMENSIDNLAAIATNTKIGFEKRAIAGDKVLMTATKTTIQKTFADYLAKKS